MFKKIIFPAFLCICLFNPPVFAATFIYYDLKENPPYAKGGPPSFKWLQMEDELAKIHINLPRQEFDLYRKTLWTRFSITNKSSEPLEYVLEEFKVTAGDKVLEVSEVKWNEGTRKMDKVIGWNSRVIELKPGNGGSVGFHIYGFSKRYKTLNVEFRVKLKSPTEEKVIQQKFPIYQGKYHLPFLSILLGR